MTSCSTPSKRSRSSVDSQTAYSLGTYVRDTETVLCSSISRASLRAISTGRTWVRNTRPNVPSTRSAILLSRFLSTLIGGVPLPGQAQPPPAPAGAGGEDRGALSVGGGRPPRGRPPPG